MSHSMLLIVMKITTYLDILHSIDDSPAIIQRASNWEIQIWYHMNKPHRDVGPAIIFKANKLISKLWMKKGLFYRENNLPSIVTKYQKCKDNHCDLAHDANTDLYYAA
jgi:hypothetical protein